MGVNRDKLHGLVEVVDKDQLIQNLINWLDEDECEQFMGANGYDDDEEELDEEAEEEY